MAVSRHRRQPTRLRRAERLRGRQISEADIPAIAVLVSRGCPSHNREYWLRTLKRLRRRANPAGRAENRERRCTGHANRSLGPCSPLPSRPLLATEIDNIDAARALDDLGDWRGIDPPHIGHARYARSEPPMSEPSQRCSKPSCTTRQFLRGYARLQ
jgi:hypothetical protein